ncbi:MAG: hypothetical protein V1837_03945 [Candidatus Woesearchaeota archaeon]
MNMIAVIIVLILAANIACAADFSDYPTFLTNAGVVDVTFVIGDNADIADAIGAVDIATSLQFYSAKRIESASMLASEITDVGSQNMIVVGGPCANPVAAKLMGFPADCMEGFKPGTAMVKLFETPKSISIIVAGLNAQDTRRACRIMADFTSYKDQFKGTEIEVSGTSSKEVYIKKVA